MARLPFLFCSLEIGPIKGNQNRSKVIDSDIQSKAPSSNYVKAKFQISESFPNLYIINGTQNKASAY